MRFNTLGLISSLLLASAMCAQDGNTVSLSQGSAPLGYQLILGYRTLTISGVTKANPAVATTAAHGFAIGSTFTGYITGATGSGWTAINAYWTATVISSTTFSIATDSSGFGTLGGAVVFYTGLLAYTCTSTSFDSKRLNTQIAISAISKANPAVVTSVGHGFPISDNATSTGMMERPQVVISGATGTGWTGVNGTFTATVIDADTFSLYTQAGVAVDSSGFGTLAGTVVFATSAPRLSIYEWAVKKFAYDPAGSTIFAGWLTGRGSSGSPATGSSRYLGKCSDGTSTTLNQQ